MNNNVTFFSNAFMLSSIEITTTAITTAAITSTIYLVIGLLLCTVFFFFVAVIALIVRLIMHGEYFCFIIIHNAYIVVLKHQCRLPSYEEKNGKLSYYIDVSFYCDWYISYVLNAISLHVSSNNWKTVNDHENALQVSLLP